MRQALKDVGVGILIFSPWIAFFVWATLLNRVDWGVLITPMSRM